MELQPATLSQFLEGQDGRMYEIPADVGMVVQDLRAIDPTFRVRFSERGGYFVVYQHIVQPDGRVVDHLVLTAVELDQRVVNRVREIASPDYDLVADSERRRARHERERRDALGARIRAEGDRTAFAVRKDLGLDKARIFVP